MTGAGANGPLLAAATLLLVRDAGGIEVFMVRRPSAADFGGMYVFPGGKVDAADAETGHLCPSLDDAEASRRLGIERGGLAYWVAAVRESFEEAGVLLARRKGATAGIESIVDAAAPDAEARLREYRHAMHEGQVTLAELCDAEGLELAVDVVHYFSHWITPKGPPRRYDTRFFVAEMPSNQQLSHLRQELTDGVWVRPGDALARSEAGEWRMIMPTATTLRTLARYRDVASLLADVTTRRHLPHVTPELDRQGMQRTVSPED